MPEVLARASAPAIMARIAASGLRKDYVVYEREGVWWYAGGALASAKLTASSLILSRDGAPALSEPWLGRPEEALERASAWLLEQGERVFGWVAFEFGAYRPGFGDRVPPDTALATLLTPEVLVRAEGDEVVVESGDEAARSAVAEALEVPLAGAGRTPTPVDVRLDPSGYRERVAQAVSEIQRGDYQKVILSRRVDLPFEVDFPASYERAREHNTPVRSFLLSLGGVQALGFSPEMVAVVRPDGLVITEPLAGTRAFGRGESEDLAARRELESDPKEIHEHAISVRGSLHDLDGVVEPGSAEVGRFMVVRERGSVQHLASTVRGRLAQGRCRMDALAALFPAVTASGLPKAEGVDAILRLDGPSRGLYSGSVFSADRDGGLDAALVLRAVYQENGRAWLRAGAGLVGQSTPEREFEETCEKLACVAEHLIAKQ
ncbi:salicylate synthase [Segniliparus rotundus DSM 44985]|uniref:Salicylate synthase n=1 Tax=Segniliparus rotundus (strain ATCC BAA-972 / CDC 1076 / CIP 108378 / DSM 44985 / JCM 13578) TaxID=640132 RepID=D6ZDF4_SEGRD|nr:salicylate synthase [Segniliparus rotundus DSM 44985]